jgi:hypothetical protein
VNDQDEIQKDLSDRFSLTNAEDWFQHFVERIDYLVQTDFPKLVNILYGLDVSEKKLSEMLKEHPGTDAAEIIARLIIERQRKKIHTRALYKKPGDDIPEADKW